jgi:hypothetical protein
LDVQPGTLGGGKSQPRTLIKATQKERHFLKRIYKHFSAKDLAGFLTLVLQNQPTSAIAVPKRTRLSGYSPIRFQPRCTFGRFFLPRSPSYTSFAVAHTGFRKPSCAILGVFAEMMSSYSELFLEFTFFAGVLLL